MSSSRKCLAMNNTAWPFLHLLSRDFLMGKHLKVPILLGKLIILRPYEQIKPESSQLVNDSFCPGHRPLKASPSSHPHASDSQQRCRSHAPISLLSLLKASESPCKPTLKGPPIPELHTLPNFLQ